MMTTCGVEREENAWEREQRVAAVEALFSACEEGSAEEVIRLLDSQPPHGLHANVVAGAEKREAPSKSKGREDEVKLELRGLMSADELVAERSHGQRPLHVATMYGHVTTVTALLARGADVTATDPGGRTALHYACALDTAAEAEEMAAMLLEAGSDVNAADEEGQTPLLWAVNYCQEASLIELLVARGARLDVTTTSGHNVLIECVHAGLCSQQPEAETVAMLRLFLEKGADVNGADTLGNSPLHWASQFGMADTSQFLLGKGADATLKNGDGKTAQQLSEEDASACFVTSQEA